MADCLYSAKGWVETWCEPEKNAIRVKWYNYTSRIHLRKCCEMQVEAMEKYQIIAIVSDASEALGIPYPQDQEWLDQYLHPRTIELGLRAVISVMPKNMIARSGAINWNNNGKKSGIQHIEVANMEEAELVLNQFRENLHTGLAVGQ